MAPVLDIHEIARGPHRKEALEHRCTWNRLCRGCHEKVGGWSIAQQLCLKQMWDPLYYDRVAVNRIRGRQDEAVNQDEVDAEQEFVASQMSPI